MVKLRNITKNYVIKCRYYRIEFLIDIVMGVDYVFNKLKCLYNDHEYN